MLFRFLLSLSFLSSSPLSLRILSSFPFGLKIFYVVFPQFEILTQISSRFEKLIQFYSQNDKFCIQIIYIVSLLLISTISLFACYFTDIFTEIGFQMFSAIVLSPLRTLTKNFSLALLNTLHRRSDWQVFWTTENQIWYLIAQNLSVTNASEKVNFQ